MTSSEYWETRTQQIFDMRQKDMAVEELYRGVYRRFHSEVKQLYEELGKRDLKRSEMYRAAKFLSFRRQLQEHLTDISGSMNDKMSRALVKAYKDAGLAAKESIGAKSVWTVQNRKMAEACINRKWAGDSFSGRIWKNRNQLAKTVEKGICDIIITGRGRNELLKELNRTDYRERFTAPKGAPQEEIEAQLEAYLQRGRRQADCLVRTELMHTINTAQIETYRSEGVNYLAFECEPTACPECLAIAEGNPYPIDKIPCTIGHPRCRCTWLAVEDEDVPEMIRKRGNTQVDFRGKTLKAVDKSVKHDIIKIEKSGTAVNGVKTIGKIDIKKYQFVTKDIKTDEVIITDERIQHIKERHPNDYERYYAYMEDIVVNPDYIIEANKPNTALILKEFSDGEEQFKTVLRLITSADDSKFKNSIITFMKINEKEWNRLLRNKKILYKSENL